jgi:predicted methyltransferase
MKTIHITLLSLALVACSHASAEPIATDKAANPKMAVYEAAVANAARPDADRARDPGRKPAKVLEFVGIVPGMTVLDMFSGGGYYTEILSYLVGDAGKVFAHSNEAYVSFVGDEFEMRYLGGRLPNVEILMAENNELSLKADAFDAVLLVLAFHDLYYAAPDDGWPAFDVPVLLAELYKGLKVGGVVGIVDHYAAEGSPPETGGTTHRIDPAIVIEAMTAAGFKLDGRSDLLRNPADDYGKVVFDPEVQGKTDRFILRFRKPGSSE